MKFFYNTYIVMFIFAAMGFFVLSPFTYAEEDKNKEDFVNGNVVCLVPDLKRGNVSPVIANESCKGHKVHAHVIVDTSSSEGNIYAVQGSSDAISRLQSINDKKNITVKGKISGNQKALILTVE